MVLRKRIGQIVRAVWGANDAVAPKRRHSRSLCEVQALEPRRLFNAAPAISGDPSVHEGSLYTLNLASNDMDGEGVAFWTINWGDGNTQQFGGDPSTAQHIYNVNATTETITASVTENGSGSGYGDGYGGGYGDGYGGSYGGTYSSNSLSVDVLGNLPTATIGSTSANPEANVAYNAVVFSGYPTSDSNNGTIQSVNVGWGDGTSTTYYASSYPGGVLPQPLPVTHTYSSGSGSGAYAVTATATDQYSAGLPDTITVRVADASLAPVEIQTTAQYGSIQVNWLAGGSTPAGTTYSVYENTTDTMPSTPLASGLTGTSYTDTSSAASVANQKYFIWVVAVPASGSSAASEGPATTVPPADADGLHTISHFLIFGVDINATLGGLSTDGSPRVSFPQNTYFVGPWGSYTSSNTYGANADFILTHLDGIVQNLPEDDAHGDAIANVYYDGNLIHQLPFSATGYSAVDLKGSTDLPEDTHDGNPLQWSRWDLSSEFSGQDSIYAAGMIGIFTESVVVAT